VLSLVDVSKNFGGLTAVSGLNFRVEDGEILALIGPNGAGKTTVLNLITGIYPPSDGKLMLQGEDITSLKPYQINRRGIARTFQNSRLFSEMTVLENIRVGQESVARRRTGDAPSWWCRLAGNPRAETDEIIEFLDLKQWRDVCAREVPYGYQRRVEIARALATHPRILLLDEPACGMNDEETKSLMNDIQMIKNRGCTIVMVEHDMNFVMGLSDRILVLNFGRKIAEGTPEMIRQDPLVQEAYLGSENGGYGAIT
jgi:branched-chain amino acid transport system ATP-binding protein